MPKPENPEGPTSIKVDNIPSDVRKKMKMLKRVNMLMGGPTEYKKMVIEALKYWIDSPENRKKLDMAEELLKQSGQEEAEGGER